MIYRFSPEQAVSGRFERIGGGIGYVWGNGMGFFEYLVPKRQDWRRVGEIIVRARAQPVPPWDSRGHISQTSVTLFINNINCGSRLVVLESGGEQQQQRIPMQEWRVDSPLLRFAAARGASLSVRLTVTADAEHPYGLNITKFEDFNIADRAPIEIEIH
ncbi:MAG: hypothetical protein WKF84_15510 [Pyrinomonadaceae bacterium]